MIIKEWDNNLIVTDNFLTNLPISKLLPINTDGLSSDDLMLISKKCSPSNMTETGFMSYYATFNDLSIWMNDVLDIDTIKLDINQLSIDLDRLLPYEDYLSEISNTYVSAIVDVEQNGKFNPFVISALYTEKGLLLSSLNGYRFADAMSNIFDWKKFSNISANICQFDNIQSNNTLLSNVIALDGIFENLSVTNRLSATALTVNSGNISTLVSQNSTTNNLQINNTLTVNENITAKQDINITGKVTANSGNITSLTATNVNINTNLSVSNKIETKDLVATGNTSLKNLTVNGIPYNQLSVVSESDYNNGQKQSNYFYFTY